MIGAALAEALQTEAFEKPVDVKTAARFLELLAPNVQFRQPEPNRAPHHSKMGNLLPLNISIDQRRMMPVS